jgi:hypothetical protein
MLGLTTVKFTRQSSFSGRKAGSFTGLTGALYSEGTLEGAGMSLCSLIEPYLETPYDELPAEVKSHVAGSFAPDNWNQTSPAARSDWAYRCDVMREEDEAVSAQIISTNAYWFELQSEILSTERDIADWRLRVEKGGQDGPTNTKLGALQTKLAALHARWHQPDDSVAREQLAAGRAAIDLAPAVLNIARALEFLSESSGVTWTEAQLLSLVSKNDICLYADVPPWTPLHIIQWEDIGLRKRPFIKPGRAVLAILHPDHVQELWVTGQSSTSTTVSEEPFSVGINYVYLDDPVTVFRRDVRLTQRTLMQVLKKWEESRQPIAPLGVFDNVAEDPSYASAGKCEEPTTVTRSESLGLPVTALPSGPTWILKAQERVRDPLATMIYQTLKAAQAAGHPRPKARQVMEAIAESKHSDFIELTDHDEIKFLDKNGNPDTADIEEVRSRINRITIVR